jgi:hypothetical protein
MSSSNARLLADLKRDIAAAAEPINQLVRDYQGYLNSESRRKRYGVGASAKGFLDMAQEAGISAALTNIREKLSELARAKDWQTKMEKLESMHETLTIFRDHFIEASSDFFDSTGSDTIGNANTTFKQATIKYLTALELVNNAYSQMAEALGSSNRINDPRFKPRYNFLVERNSAMAQASQEFVSKVNEATETLITRQLFTPADHLPIDLNKAINTLTDRYNQAYTAAYGEEGGFWRWVKNLFKKTERTQEMAFLAAVSNAPNCTDEVRREAITLVNNKIKSTEWFGGGSKLGSILGALAQSTITVNRDTDSSLCDFLERNPSIRMPGDLSDYYNSNLNDYNQIGVSRPLG